ncbi:unnamed protein product [Heterosigma akashiwo]
MLPTSSWVLSDLAWTAVQLVDGTCAWFISASTGGRELRRRRHHRVLPPIIIGGRAALYISPLARSALAPIIVYKKKDASLPENYRPISVLPTLATTFERVLMKQLSSFLFGHIRPTSLASYLVRGPWMSASSSPTQSPWPLKPGKMCGWLRSTSRVPLIRCGGGVFLLISGRWVGVRSKAFKLMQSYLSDRALFVVANGDSSSHMSIKSGVPRGAILVASPL